MVAGVRFKLTTFGLCDLTQLSPSVGLYPQPVETGCLPSSLYALLDQANSDEHGHGWLNLQTVASKIPPREYISALNSAGLGSAETTRYITA